jgi:hypothetical protein
MKNKLCIAGLVLISILTYSCSNDEESFEVQGVKAKEFKGIQQSVLQQELNARVIDSTAVELNKADGDPSIIIPPRPK